MGFVNMIGIACIVVLVLAAVYSLWGIIRFFLMFYLRHCKECGHLMEFKGHEEVDGKVYYKFYCEHCGLWEKISMCEMIPDNEASTD